MKQLNISTTNIIFDPANLFINLDSKLTRCVSGYYVRWKRRILDPPLPLSYAKIQYLMYGMDSTLLSEPHPP